MDPAAAEDDAAPLDHRSLAAKAGLSTCDANGRTNEAYLEQKRAEFRAEYRQGMPAVPSQHQNARLATHFDLDTKLGRAKAKRFMKAHKISKSSLDSRLSRKHTLRVAGMTVAQIAPKGQEAKSPLQRIQHLVRRQPSCLAVPTTPSPADRGEYFEEITSDLLAREIKLHKPLGTLTGRIHSEMQCDGWGLMSGSRMNPQPRGRYIQEADIISMHNRSLGKCPCGRDIWLYWKPEWNEDPANAPDEDSEAQIQRLDNSIIHLVSNCADTLVCRLCQPATNHNRLVTRRDP